MATTKKAEKSKAFWLDFKKRYVRETGNTTCTVLEIYTWGLDQNLWDVNTKALVKSYVCSRLSHALKEDKDEQGNRLHYCHTAEESDEDGKPVQTQLWAHIDDAPRTFLRSALAGRRDQAHADLRAIERDLTFVNARLRVRGEKPIQLQIAYPPPEPDGPPA